MVMLIYSSTGLMNEAPRKFDIVVLNPPMVYGPPRQSAKSINDLNVTTNSIWKGFFLNATPETALCVEWLHADIDVRVSSRLLQNEYRADPNSRI
jgi:hypothetical protein